MTVTLKKVVLQQYFRAAMNFVCLFVPLLSDACADTAININQEELRI